MLQLHLSDQQFIAYEGASYIRDLMVVVFKSGLLSEVITVLFWWGHHEIWLCLDGYTSEHNDQGWGQFNSGIGIAAQFQFQFRNWNWNWWNWKWNWNWKPWHWNWNWKPKLNFLQLLLQQLLVNQPFPNFSFNRGGHNLLCDWLLMQQVFLGHWHERHMDRVPCSPWVDRGQKD